MSADDNRFEERWRHRFERYAAARDDDAGIAGWSEGGLAARFRQFSCLWHRLHRGAGPSGRWLDAGCGAGTYTRFLAAQGLQVTAVDYSEPTAYKARERSPGDMQWAVADATCLPFATGAFDGVLCFGVMQALSAPDRALRELRRVLSSGGTLWVDALNAACLPSAWSEARRFRRGAPPHLRYDRRAVFAEALMASGFSMPSLHWIPILPGRLRRLQPLVETAAAGALLHLPPLGAWGSHSFLAVARADGARPTA